MSGNVANFKQLGKTGPQGPQGIQGPVGLQGNPGLTGAIGRNGPAGRSGQITIGGVSGVEPTGSGSSQQYGTATVTTTGSSSDTTISFGIPTGLTGPSPNLLIGTITDVRPDGESYGNATVSFTESANNTYKLNLAVPSGLTGDTGATGPPITVGTVSTVTINPPGVASVGITQNGDTYDFDFGIPKGEDGSITDIGSNLVPGANATYDIGTTAKFFKDGYFSGNLVFSKTNNLTLSVSTQATGIATLSIPDLGGNGGNIVVNNLAQTLTNKTLTAPKFGSAGKIDDANGNELIKFPSVVANATNEITISNAATSNGPSISATGSDTNIDLNLIAKGTGNIKFTTNSNTGTLTFGAASKTLTVGSDLTTSGTKTTITGVDQANTLTLNEGFTIGDGNTGTLTFGAASKTLTVSDSITLDGGSKTLTLNENLTIGDGTDITITGAGQANTLTLNEGFTIGDGSAGTLTFSAGSKTLTVSASCTIDQNLGSDQTVAFNRLSIPNTAATTTDVVSISSDALTTGSALDVTSSSTGKTSGGLVNIAQTGVTTTQTDPTLTVSTSATTQGGVASFTGNALTAGDAVTISSDALTTGSALDVTSSSTGKTSGGLVNIAQTGVTTTQTDPTLTVSTSATTQGGVASFTGNALTTSDAVSITGNALTTGSALDVTSNSADKTSGGLVNIAQTGTEANQSAPTLTVSTSATTDASAGVASFTGDNLTTGNAVSISATRLTTGSALKITGSSDKTALNVSAGDATFAGNVTVSGAALTQSASTAITTIKDTNPTGSASTGGNLKLAMDDGAACANGHRLGVIEFQGAEDNSGTLVTGARIEATTDATWSGTENGASLKFLTTDADAVQSVVLTLDSDKKATFGGDVAMSANKTISFNGSTDTNEAIYGDGGYLYLKSNAKTFKMPNTIGSVGQALVLSAVSDPNGTLSWATPTASGGSVDNITGGAAGDILIQSATNSTDFLTKGDIDTVLQVSSGGTLQYGTVTNEMLAGSIDMANKVTGTLAVANGGTGISSFGAGVATFLGTPSSANLRSAITDETGSGSLVFATSPTLVTPVLGTPASGTLTSCTGLPISSGVSGLGTGVATFLGTPISAHLRTAVTDETGTGSLVFATSPTLVTPVLGTPASGTLTSCTGLPISSGVSGLGTGVATFLGTPISAHLRTAVTDETGTGSLVFATSPTLVTPALGTPSGGDLSNCTFPTLNQSTTGTASGLSSTLAISSGGTGLTTVAKGSILVANTANTLSALDGGGTNGFLYYAGGSDTISWTTQSTTRSNLGLGTTNSPTFTGLTIGDGSNPGTITSNSTQDLVLNTNSGTNSGTITMTNGENGNITVTPNGTGDVVVGTDLTISGGDITLGKAQDGTLSVEATDSGTNGKNLTITAGGTADNNDTGGNLILQGGATLESGVGAGGQIEFQVAADNSYSSALIIDKDQTATFAGNVTVSGAALTQSASTAITTIKDTNPTGSASTGGNLKLAMDDGAACANGHRLGVIEFQGAEDNSGTLVTGARIEATTDATWSGTENGASLKFLTTDADAVQSVVLTLDSDKKATFAGDVALNGDVTIAANKDILMQGSGTFTSGTGAVTLAGVTGVSENLTVAADKNITMTAGTGTFTSGTGAVALNGDVTIAADKDILMQGSGTFTSGTGAVTLAGVTGVSENLTVAADKNITMTAGTGTFTSGTGAVALNGDVTVASGKNVGMSGASTFTSGTGAVALNGPTGVSGIFTKKTTVTTVNTAGNETYSAAQLLGGFILRDPAGTDRTDTTPTAAEIVAAIPNASVGSSFEFTIRNTADHNESITLGGGTNVTLSPTTIVIPRDYSETFLVVCTNVTSSSEEVTIYSLHNSLY